MPVNLGTYEQFKKNGNLKLVRVNADTVAVVSKQYNADDGEPAADKIENVSISEQERIYVALMKDLDNLKIFIDDMKKVAAKIKD